MQRRNEDPRNRGYGSPYEGGQQNQSQDQQPGSQIGGWSDQPGGQASPGSQQHSQYSGSSGQYGGIPSAPAGSPYGTPYAPSYGDEQPYGSQPSGRQQNRGASSHAGGAPYGQYSGEYGQSGQGSDFGRRGYGPIDQGRFQQQRGQGQHQRWDQGDFGFPQGRDPGYGREPGWNAQDFNRGRGYDDERENERRYGGHYGAVDDPSRIRDYGDRDTSRGSGGYGGPGYGRQRQDWSPQRGWNQRSSEEQQQRSEPRDWGTYGFPNHDDIYGTGQQGQRAQPDHPGSQQQHHDPDYHQWRSEQLQNFDNDYQRWRQERYRKFSDEFDNWRRQNAGQHNTVQPAQTHAGGLDTENAPGSTRGALGGAAAGSESGDLRERSSGASRTQGTSSTPAATGGKSHNK